MFEEEILLQMPGAVTVRGISWRQVAVPGGGKCGQIRAEQSTSWLFYLKIFCRRYPIDMRLPLACDRIAGIELELLDLLERIQKPLFAEKESEVLSPRTIGKIRNVLKFRVQDRQGKPDEQFTLGMRRTAPGLYKREKTSCHLLYPSVNDYMVKTLHRLQ